MRKIGFLAAIALLGAIACDSVLDIEEPKARPEERAGDGGETPTLTGGAASAGTASGGAASGNGGTSAGAVDQPVGGFGGDAGAPGGAGAPPAKDCEAGELRCTELAPELCDESGHWAHNLEEAAGDCAVLCVGGRCAECRNDEQRCTTCEEGDQNCSSRLPQTCVEGAWRDADAACKAYCDVGSGKCVSPPSCTEFNAPITTCTGGLSCCASLLVPGGEFVRNFDADEPQDYAWPAKVSSFYLDKFEVTVGRFKQFLIAYDGLDLEPGDGKSAHIAGDEGWTTGYDLPTKSDLLASLSGCSGTTWSDSTAPADNTKPVNCVPFNVAYAFCVWDKGRLPTETEWNYAAAGGDEQREYPWRTPLVGPEISTEHANYDNSNPGPVAVGLTPAGDGRWGQSDLAGNVSEWMLDYWGEPPLDCSDCLNSTSNTERTLRGGSYQHDQNSVKVAVRTSDLLTASRTGIGFRCARDLD